MAKLLFAILMFLACEAQQVLSEYDEDDRQIMETETSVEDPHKILLDNHYYKIDNAELGQTLSAEFEGKITPEPVSLLPWEEKPFQMWKADHIDEGVILTPYLNDYNEVTSFFQSGATAYHVWNLGIPPPTRVASSYGEGPFLLINAQKKCLQGSRRYVTFADCRMTDKRQLWRFQEIQEDERK